MGSGAHHAIDLGGVFVNYRRITQLGTALAVAGALCTPGARAANDAMIEQSLPAFAAAWAEASAAGAVAAAG